MVVDRNSEVHGSWLGYGVLPRVGKGEKRAGVSGVGARPIHVGSLLVVVIDECVTIYFQCKSPMN